MSCTEPLHAELAMPAESAASAVAYWEWLSARVRAGHLPDAVVAKVRHHTGSCLRKHHSDAQRAQVDTLLAAGGRSHRAIAARVGCGVSYVAYRALKRTSVA